MKLNTITFEKRKGSPLYRQLYEKIRDDILNGYMKQGDQLPSIRACEKLLKISKTSVEKAYDILLMEGYIQAMPQKGYYIAVDEAHLSIRKTLIEKPFANHKTVVRYDFRSQTMDKDAFDTTLWKRYIKEVLEEHEEIGTYGDAQGEYALRLALAQYAYAMRGVLGEPDDFLIGASFQSLLYILCGYFHSDTVIGLEESGFLQAEQVFSDYGFSVRKLTSQEDGIAIQELVDKNIDVLYLNAGSSGKQHQAVSMKKKKALLSWAKQYDRMIIEDDHNGELRYQSKMQPCMQGFDMKEHVLYIGSFSKLLLPSLRISYLVMNQAMKHQFQANRYGPSASKIEQLAMARYISDGHLERHCRRLKKRYEQKSKQMLLLIKKECREVDCILEEAALQIILRFPYSVDVDGWILACAKNHILMNKNIHQEIVLSFAGIASCDMEAAIKEIWMIAKPYINVDKQPRIDSKSDK